MKLNKKTTAVLAAGILVASAGGAYAYWTTTGSGDGAATNASSNGTVDLHAAFDDGLTPGAHETVTYTADNRGSSNLFVTAITPTVTTSKAACLPAWFTIAPTTPRTTVGAGLSGVSVGTSVLYFVDSTTVNQDACQSAIVTVTLASS
ncbi:MAG: hypothetical protein HHJ13_10245 [Phycicoccus sp.]|nr:hypothetical protein [Phycicoccus sp.]